MFRSVCPLCLQAPRAVSERRLDLVDAINQNQLALFLLANLSTGQLRLRFCCITSPRGLSQGGNAESEEGEHAS